MEYYKIIQYRASYNASTIESTRKTHYGRHKFVCYEPADTWVTVFSHFFFFVYLHKSTYTKMVIKLMSNLLMST